MKDNIIQQKSYAFAVQIVRLYKRNFAKREYPIARQLLRSGTSVGANVSEAVRAVSKKDFANKMGIALKEAGESGYWLDLLFDTGDLPQSDHDSLRLQCEELVKILVAIVKTANEE
jgi:four helix bundle protein